MGSFCLCGGLANECFGSGVGEYFLFCVVFFRRETAWHGLVLYVPGSCICSWLGLVPGLY